MKFNKAIGYFIPPLIIIIYRKIKSTDLFTGRDASLFLENAYLSKVYGEYGVGKTTKLVRLNSDALIIAVDTNSEYLRKIITKISPRSDDQIFYKNIGLIARMGYPIDYSKRSLFKDYFESLWKFKEKPDFVLIDGRFRVACFLTSLIHAEPGTLILFDDYDRCVYHVVEEIILPTRTTSTQALFVVPKIKDLKLITELRDLFSMVMQ
jgi:hypothetical protein